MLQKRTLFTLLIFLISGTLYATPALTPLRDTLPTKQQPAGASNVDTAAKEFVGIEAEFPGGEQGWKDFMGKNLNPEVPVVNGAPAGEYKVIVQFVVDSNGYVKGILPLTRHGFGMEAEVVRVIKKSPRWQPAKLLDGKTVNAYRKQPITFSVSEAKRKRRLF